MRGWVGALLLLLLIAIIAATVVQLLQARAM